MLVIYDIVSDIPDIIIVQVIEFVSITSVHLICVPFLSVVAVKIKLVVSPELLMFTNVILNLLIIPLLTCSELTISMGLLSDGEEYQRAGLFIIVQVTAPFVCGHIS